MTRSTLAGALALLGSLALVPSCGRGFALQVNVEQGCATAARRLAIEVELRPSGEQRMAVVEDVAAFFAGSHRVAVIPTPQATEIRVTVTALDGSGGAIAAGTVLMPVAGAQLVEQTLLLTGCGGGDGPWLDGGSTDLPPGDLAAVEASIPDLLIIDPRDGGPGDGLPGCTESSCKGLLPVCDKPSGRCVACLGDLDCPLGTLCKQKSCLPGCALDRGCGDGGTCSNGSCKACKGDGDCNGSPLGAWCDPANDTCGACRLDQHCKPSEVCRRVNGLLGCVPRCKVKLDCMAGTDCCGGLCVDQKSDPANCGGCGTACMVKNGTPGCAMGQCTIAACSAPWADCNKSYADGCEINTTSSAGHCGGCGITCVAQNGAAGCNSGCYIVGCNAPFQDCDNKYENGCETNTSSDAKNCRACGNQCVAAMNATPACRMSVCGLGGCVGLFKDCNGNSIDGCEVDGASDVAHCGGCGQACKSINNGTPGCSGGKCGVGSCSPDFADCNKDPVDGCETALAGDVKNCGACGNACMAPNNACVDKKCVVAGCDPPFKDCDKNPNNGCETNTSNSVAHCGDCNAACPPLPNSAPLCQQGKCVVNCNAPFKDCNQMPGDGCEINTASDAAHCGGCGMKCPPVSNGAPGCSAGKCGIASCNAPWDNCDGVVANGCEVNTSSDVNHCAKCGNKCSVANGAAKCDQSSCAIASCNAPFRDCVNGYADGCETNTADNVSHCGGCGIACTVAHGAPKCGNGGCRIDKCDPPWQDCDGKYANGCETDTDSDPANCGGCGKLCPGDSCLNGVCFGGGGGDMAVGPRDMAMGGGGDLSMGGGGEMGGNNNCLNGGKAPPAGCTAGKDPGSNSPYVVCQADCNQAWLSQAGAATGPFHAQWICTSLGYSGLSATVTDCARECGLCGGLSASSCKMPDPSGMGGKALACDQPNDPFGTAFCGTVAWYCRR